MGAFVLDLKKERCYSQR